MSAELKAYRRFFKRLADHFWADGYTQMDGGDFQEWGVADGVIREVPFDPGCHGNERGDEFGLEPGDQWFEAAYPLKDPRP